MPDGYDDKLQAFEPSVGCFMHMCLIRCLREDRTLITAEFFIAETLGKEYIQPVTDSI
jgi:hypothetical protein